MLQLRQTQVAEPKTVFSMKFDTLQAAKDWVKFQKTDKPERFEFGKYLSAPDGVIVLFYF